MVITLRNAAGLIGAGILSAACALAAGCGAAGSTAPHAAVVAATHRTGTHRFCVDEIATPTATELARINRYWTPLARSALTVVSEGKMSVAVPKKHLTGAQRRALRLAEWAERTFSPKPKVVCEPLPAGGVPASAPAMPPQPAHSAGT
jgi:hypothetical protein